MKLINAINREICIRDFWEYEKYLDPDFFREDRPHLKKMANTLQMLYESKLLNSSGIAYKKLMINLPPRHGKSYTLIMFNQWILGLNNTNKIINISYNETLSSRFSKSVRNGIDQNKIDDNFRTFSDVFPATKIKQGDASFQLWSLEKQPFNFLGGSLNGTITGIGANIGIIDDLIKNRYEAFNEVALEKMWNDYIDTYLSRLEEGALQIINFTRWSKKDLCGRLLAREEAEWYVLKMPAETNGIMLCPALLSHKSFEDKKKLMSSEIIQANYYQEPIDIKGRLYGQIKTYADKREGVIVKSYTDTADEGDDFLCTIFYYEYQGEVFIVDVVYTQDGAEKTEPLVKSKIVENDCRVSDIESNSGGRAFARNVERLLGSNSVYVINWFHQSKNKKARIISNSFWIAEHVYFPENWENRWSDFARDLLGYTKTGKNKHDDAPDALTGVVEKTVQEKERAIIL
jgi:predicted phage terminase large subunit-like protein